MYRNREPAICRHINWFDPGGLPFCNHYSYSFVFVKYKIVRNLGSWFGQRKELELRRMEQFDYTDSPLHQDVEGSIRVIGSRITLDTLVHKFQLGDTPEDLHEGFPSLSLAQIRAVIAWYLIIP
jgi:hypothetical protein